jgi:hypothetical protein
MTQLSFKLKQIGIIRTPYTDNAPYQPGKKRTPNTRACRFSGLGALAPLKSFGKTSSCPIY